MDPNNYRIHKRRAPGYTPRVGGPAHNRLAPQKPTTVSVSPQQRPPQLVQKPIPQMTPPKPAMPPKPTPMAPRPQMRMASAPVAATPKPKQTTPQRPKMAPQPIPARTITTPPRPSASKPEYVFEAPNVQSANKKTKKPKRKKLKRALIALFTLLILGGLAFGGYYYYTNYYKDKAQVTDQPTAQTVNSTTADFTLYKTKDGSTFKSMTTYEDGKEKSKILTANSTKDNRQVVISQQQVDRYFSTDPNGLDKLLQSTGAHDGVSTNNGMSYIVKGGTTAITVRDETLIIIRSTGELKTEEWVDLFNNLEKTS